MLFLGEGGGGALSLNCLVIEIKYDIFGDAIASSYAHICLLFFIQLKEKMIRYIFGYSWKLVHQPTSIYLLL